MSNRVKLVKTSPVNDDYVLLSGYTVEGELIQPIEPGTRIMLARDKRNGVEVPGLFTSSLIRNISVDGSDEIRIETENSTWIMTNIEE